ncbi:TIGR00341 family protein [Amphibacillus cookii]|uniref:TIGR00341 family protein n=1 Tax=Amphibacillus cookii TaxID=767787 RepID=UPI001959EB5D|nr:TIGR00341 family protein [Amphibacillus cookii]MBM7539912.1 putative hydrophobic protein (TIGR00341 family) [Amphibacillus cookii]
MELQLVEVYLSNQRVPHFLVQLDSFQIVSQWQYCVSDQEQVFKLLVEKQYAEEILDFLEAKTNDDNQMEALLFNVSTYLPHMDEEEAEERQTKAETEMARASRHELYHVVEASSHFTINFRWMLVLSSIVATAGIVKDSSAVVIGAMVIAPLIGPFTSLAFSTLLGDYKLMQRSSGTSLIGLFVPLLIAMVFGFFFDVPINSGEFLARTDVGMMDIILALAAGAAGALSFVKRVSEALVGVMVSVALLPPTVVLGMSLGAGEWGMAITPLLLVLVNVHAIVLSAIIVFWLTGIKPINWQEVQVANTSRVIALFFVSAIIILLAVIIYFSL